MSHITDKPRIALLAHNCRAGGSLIGTMNLLKALNRISVNEKFLIIYPKGYGYENVELPTATEVYVYSGSHSSIQRYWFETVSLPQIVRKFRPNVICGLGNIGLNRPGIKQAVFIHNPYPLYDKSECPDMPLRVKLRAFIRRLQFRNSAANADVIFCQTPIVKKRFAARFGYPANRIHIIRWPPPVEITASADTKFLPGLDKSGGTFYILLLTRYLYHRNPSVLIPLCSKYASEFRRHRIRFITTLDGERNRPSALFLKDVRDKHLDDIVTNVGAIDRKDVPSYLRHSDVLWMPTFIETLCLPFLEAMVIGVPILAPNLDFARYVCGEAAVFYGPWDIDSAFAKIMLLRQDSNLRNTLSKHGKVELADRNKFSANWEEVAVDMSRALRRLAKE